MSAEITRVELVSGAAKSGANDAMALFRDDYEIEMKANENDPVTEADYAAQQTIIEQIRTEFPDDVIVAEEDEHPSTVPEEGVAWVIDPIDGTVNYIRGLPLWTTTIGLIEDGSPVGAASVLPISGDVYTADQDEVRLNGDSVAVSERTDTDAFVVGVLGSGAAPDHTAYAALTSAVVENFGELRRFGSTTAALAFVASGGLDIAVTATPKSSWDLLAGIHMVECAGGTVTTLDGESWHANSEAVVASNGCAHDMALDIVRESTQDTILR
jgi:myo-inositol-1(or 4)-monophosphatase